MKLFLRPSGKLLILGLYKETTISDYMYSAISVPLNLIYLNYYSTTNLTSTLEAPTSSAQLSLKQIKSVANSLLPNYKIQRHLFWRYSLIWQKN
jgi:hypothetical protein